MKRLILYAAVVLCCALFLTARGKSPKSLKPAKLLPASPCARSRIVLEADGIEYAFRWCPPGEFAMGGETLFGDALPVHKVALTRGFWILETEVTQAMWRSVMGTNPSEFKGEKRPVERVNWGESLEFCRKLSEKLGQKVKLPTEAQWEYACRAGTSEEYARDLDAMAWFSENSGAVTHEVKQKEPNAWGLYDMHGNVYEGCSDWYGEKYYAESPANDPENAVPSTSHVFRGGSWNIDAEMCRSADRSWGIPEYRYGDLGLRISLVPD